MACLDSAALNEVLGGMKDQKSEKINQKMYKHNKHLLDLSTTKLALSTIQ
jgi:hypothetical protein